MYQDGWKAAHHLKLPPSSGHLSPVRRRAAAVDYPVASRAPDGGAAGAYDMEEREDRRIVRHWREGQDLGQDLRGLKLPAAAKLGFVTEDDNVSVITSPSIAEWRLAMQQPLVQGEYDGGNHTSTSMIPEAQQDDDVSVATAEWKMQMGLLSDKEGGGNGKI